MRIEDLKRRYPPALAALDQVDPVPVAFDQFAVMYVDGPKHLKERTLRHDSEIPLVGWRAPLQIKTPIASQYLLRLVDPHRFVPRSPNLDVLVRPESFDVQRVLVMKRGWPVRHVDAVRHHVSDLRSRMHVVGSACSHCSLMFRPASPVIWTPARAPAPASMTIDNAHIASRTSRPKPNLGKAVRTAVSRSAKPPASQMDRTT